MNIPDDGTKRQERETASREATEALRQMGPSAVEWLGGKIEQKETAWQKRYRGIWEAMPAMVRKLAPTPHDVPDASDSILNRRILGVLVQMGPPAVPVLTNYLDASRYGQSTRYDVYRELTFLPLQASAAPALPMLEYNVNLTNSFDQVCAAYAIASIDPSRTRECVDVLRSALRSTQRDNAAIYLGNLGESANEAIPELEASLDDPDPHFRERVRVALQKVTGKTYPRK